MPSDSEKIVSLIFAIGRRMRDESQAKKKAYSMLHFHTLHYVQERRRPFMHEVAEYLRVTPPAATLLIDGLVKDRLLARVVDKHDRRAVRVALTERGKRFIARGIREKMGRLKKMFAALTTSERAQLIAIIKKTLN